MRPSAATRGYFTMRPLCSSNSLPMAITATVYFMVVITICSAKDCRLQIAEKLNDRPAFLTKTDIRLFQIQCLDDFCHQATGDTSTAHQENQPKVRYDFIIQNYVPIFTDGSKEDGHLASATVNSTCYFNFPIILEILRLYNYLSTSQCDIVLCWLLHRYRCRAEQPWASPISPLLIP